MAKEDVFTPLIKKMLIDNTHKVTIELNPDKELGKVQDEEEKAKVAAYRAGLSPEEIEKVVADTEELKRLQETPDSPEALACVPALDITDIPKEAKSIPTDVSTVGATTMLTHDIFTNDILYAEHLMVSGFTVTHPSQNDERIFLEPVFAPNTTPKRVLH